MNDLFLLAQASGEDETQGESQTPGESQTTSTKQDGTEPGKGTAPARKPSLFDSGFIWVILAMFLVIYFVMMRPQRKRQQEHKQMLGNLKRGNRIRTIGGIVGTVVDVQEDEVVVKVDESNNTKMHFVRSAIGTVLAEETAEKK